MKADKQYFYSLKFKIENESEVFEQGAIWGCFFDDLVVLPANKNNGVGNAWAPDCWRDSK
ncbi:hypothetical protein SAE01_14600 [Segetibacter aerophilus]|uniref:Uncharacterized protein n=1 Tax=Segetibacter aerophilus TaxID=670293 RepID=A0A512BAG6_9BACT|nr:hypothetical protein SAE01_14600 [Segetibacter aerophilus]